MIRRPACHAPRRGTSGSLLLMMLVAVSVVTLLALALGGWIRAQAAALEANRYRREVRNGTRQAALRWLAEHVLPDTNGWDAAAEPWAAEPWERRAGGWVLRVSGDGWRDEPGATASPVDESGKIPLNDAPVPLLAALLREAGGLPADLAENQARRLVDWRDADALAAGNGTVAESADYGTREQPWQAPNRPFVCVAELARVPGLSPAAREALMPLVTVEGPGRLNLNTAPETALRAALTTLGGGDTSAALRLLERILAFRRAGKGFTRATAMAITRDLGGLPADEAALLGRIEGYITVGSTAVSGVAEATPAAAWAAGRRGGRAYFTWHRERHVFTRWADE
jgi:type II secretory pathway component PulK